MPDRGDFLPMDVGVDEQLKLEHSNRLRAECPNCGRDSAFYYAGSTVVWPNAPNDTEEQLMVDRQEFVVLRLWTCTICNKSCAYLVEARPLDTELWSQRSHLAWPLRGPRNLPSEAPDKVRSFYREASICEGAGALRGAAGLYRACVEALVEMLEIPDEHKGLKARINALRQKGVDDDLVTDLHEARIMGDWSLHRAKEFGIDEIRDVAALIADAVETLFVLPARKRAMRDRRAAQRSQPTESTNPSNDADG